MAHNKDKISSNQLAILLFSYLTGSAIVNVPGPIIALAKNDAWLSLLLALCGGFLILLGMLYLNRLYPEQGFIEMSSQIVGRPGAIGLVWLIIPFAFHLCTGISLDIGLFLKSSLMRETPLYIFCGFIFGLAAITVRCGIEVIARMFTLLVVIVMLFTISVWLLAVPDYEPIMLLPVMPNGLAPVLHGAYSSFGFPYGEMGIFLFLFSYVRSDEQSKLKKPLLIALLLNGVTLIFSILSTIMIFGPMAGERKYSLFEVARVVEVQEIIQRIESVIGMSLIAGSYMKVTIALFILNKAFTELFKPREPCFFVYPLTLVCYLMAINFKGDTRWVYFVSVIHPLWVTLILTSPILILVIVAKIKRWIHPIP
ncbi:GerAB/ArcD/ProY family transporter [Paenibacillus agricola]|uniref:Endospore germination permease n=1 Tax=Paenibacillus agricola TaxID=2716264 RepID=A0ABX0J3T9_9BACL|nr:endospore germination permease [Paenibacillus agricola]NHN30995.1 endospore germination permease [Paenibacillus agricola]